MVKKKKQYYSDLAPSERIQKIIKEFIFPELENLGFKLLKSGLSIKRDKDGFVQEIWFSKSKWNTGNEICEIEPHFSVTNKNYKKWYKNYYQKDLKTNIILADSAKYIDGWDLDSLDGYKYDFAKHDNQILIDLILKGIKDCGLKYLDTLCDVNSMTEYLMTNKRYFKAPMMIDFQLMNKDYKKAKLVSEWFWNYRNNSGEDFMVETINDMNEREEKITTGHNKL
ncbi:hypothetical protein [Draconibacterium sediminis]|uniref:hypothetical protein n=1 Tax=Draconibacterium sediminis TaxID=1544798 RepID=UPI0026F0CE32|nr:hypothetical protein [Draconibacterium sediminis]